MINRIKSEPQWAFNFILSILVSIIFYTAMQMDRDIQTKADKEVVAAMCLRLDQKANKDYLDRVDSGLQTQIGRLAVSIDRLNVVIEKSGG